jgi:ketosteroid isomerase-like protein
MRYSGVYRGKSDTYSHVFTIRGGKIVAVTEYLDTQLAANVLTA